MLEKETISYQDSTYAWVLCVSVGGALVHFLDTNRKKLTRDRLINLLIDIIIAPFTGFVTFFLCQAFDLSLLTSIGIIGLVSHMGPRGLIMIRNMALKRILNTSLEEKDD